MLDTVYYAELVRMAGLSHDYIAHRLHLSEPAYFSRAAGCVPFGSDEMAVLKSIFSLSADDAGRLFFANKFKLFCQDRHITGAGLAKVLKVSPATAYRYMNDCSRLKVSQVAAICRAFKVSAEAIF